MKINQPLTPEQQSMVEQNTALIHWTIQKYIDVNEAICGLGYEDLFQEGALALCYAATTYRTGGTQFQTYAVMIITYAPINGDGQHHSQPVSISCKNEADAARALEQLFVQLDQAA